MKLTSTSSSSIRPISHAGLQDPSLKAHLWAEFCHSKWAQNQEGPPLCPHPEARPLRPWRRRVEAHFHPLVPGGTLILLMFQRECRPPGVGVMAGKAAGPGHTCPWGQGDSCGWQSPDPRPRSRVQPLPQAVTCRAAVAVLEEAGDSHSYSRPGYPGSPQKASLPVLGNLELYLNRTGPLSVKSGRSLRTRPRPCLSDLGGHS